MMYFRQKKRIKVEGIIERQERSKYMGKSKKCIIFKNNNNNFI